ncbi:MAG: haloalkane dehalogenase [Roseiflexaceae bacterium]
MSTIDTTAYPFAAHFAEIGEGRMHYVDVGVGDPLIFSHGTPTWSFEWRHLIRGLSAHYRCIAPDHLGFGLSDRPRGASYTPEAHAERFSRFVDQLNLPSYTLVVHDYGGPIAFPLALREQSKVKRLIITNTWMWSFADQPTRDAAMVQRGQIVQGRFGRWMYQRLNFSLRVLAPSAYGDRRNLTPAIHRQYLDRFPDAWSREVVLWALAYGILGSSPFYHQLWQQREQLKRMPCMILWGLRDSAFQPHMLQRWRELLPEAEVIELPEAGHWPHEEQPEQMIRAIRQFLQTHA